MFKISPKAFLMFLIIWFASETLVAQNQLPPPMPAPTPIIKISGLVAKKLEQFSKDSSVVTREQREQALAKLLEAQRHIWRMGRVRSQAAMLFLSKSAREALQKALELDPGLAEAYTTLATLNFEYPPQDLDESYAFAELAVKVDRHNFGARRILARILSFKSRIGTENFDAAVGEKALAEWKEIARLDPRNAEAWAFLSEIYNQTDRNNDRIFALRKWLGASNPVDSTFYRAIMGAQEDLAPENASIKLGSALLKAGQSVEAIEILSTAVADQPDNTEAIDLLRQAIEGAEGGTTKKTLELLQQASYANPRNIILIELLAEVQSRLGNRDEAVKTLKNAIAGLLETDRSSAAHLQVALGDLFVGAERSEDAISAYEAALSLFVVDKALAPTDLEHDLAVRVFEKIINLYKSTNKLVEAKAVIERARQLFGKDDLFADKSLISLLRDTGNRQEALRVLRLVRQNFKEDYGLIRTEAGILTDLGKVDDAVALIKNLIDAGGPRSASYDDFTNYMYIASLYSQAKKGKEAISAAQQAYSAADGEERKQLAIIALATAQQKAGDYKSAEDGLRGLLKKSPNNPIALNNLGYLLLERDSSLNEAIGLIERALKIDPTNPSYLDSLGWGQYKLGNLSESEKYLKSAYKYNPTSAAILEHMGDLYLKQGKNDQAMDVWQKALTLSANSAETARIKAKISKNK